MGARVPDLQGLFLRGSGQQDFNSGGKGNVSHASGALGQIQGDTLREMTGKGSFAILSNGYDGLTHNGREIPDPGREIMAITSRLSYFVGQFRVDCRRD